MSLSILKKRLKSQTAYGLLRTLAKPQQIDLCSNDYLGFAQDKILQHNILKRLQKYPNGASGSRLLCGNLDLHEETETICASFVNREAAILFPSGYQANIALLSALLTADDLVFSDELNHASIIDGIRFSRANKIIYPHRNYHYLKQQLKTYQNKSCLKIIISESLFSMDGTLANLAELAQLAKKFNALLIIDEAHSTGLWGSSLVATTGLCKQVFATIHTGGKSLGVSGAWIAGSQLLKKYLINYARPLIFSTAPIPAIAVSLQEAIKYYKNIGEVRAQTLFKRANFFRSLLGEVTHQQENTPIISVLLNDIKSIQKICIALQKYNWHVYPIRPPSVPQHTARIRLTVKWCNSNKQLMQFANDFISINKTLRRK